MYNNLCVPILAHQLRTKMTNFAFQDAKYCAFSMQHDIKVDAHYTYMSKIDISFQLLSSFHLSPVLSRFSNVAEATAIRSL